MLRDPRRATPFAQVQHFTSPIFSTCLWKSRRLRTLVYTGASAAPEHGAAHDVLTERAHP
ncbi:hypothetical protein Gocc_2180 [Gaiella occulta]|uniref:Uncharacterized protein n=1 Tax=Gaiella occulta TaxID=1002870 RepID=A0A7M2YVC7_9ACTN|nr:hypothetical protein Gocc_2180 [Gaiella occulta]